MFVEYAKHSPDDLLIQITVHNRGPEAAELHVLPTLWFRNGCGTRNGAAVAGANRRSRQAQRRESGRRDARRADYLHCDRDVPLLFTENETNAERLFGAANRTPPYVKDGINNYTSSTGTPGP